MKLKIAKRALAGMMCATTMVLLPGSLFAGLTGAAEGAAETEPYEVIFDSADKLAGWKHTAYSKTENLGDAEIQELKWTYDPDENALTNGAKDQKMPALTLENKLYDNFEAEIVFKKTSTWGHLVFMFGRTDDTNGCLSQDGTTLAQNGVGINVSNNMGSTQDIIINYADETGNYGPHRYASFPQNDQNVGLINFNEYNTLKVVVKNHVYSVYMNGALVVKDGNALTLDNSQNPNKPGAGRIGILSNDKCYVKSVKVTPVSGEGGGGEEELPEGAVTYENAFDNENALADFVCTAYNRDTGEQLSEEIAQQQKWKYVEAYGALEYWSAGNMSAITLKGEAHRYKDFTAEFQLKKTNNWGNFMFCFGRTDDGKSGFIPHDSQDANGAAIVISGDSGHHQGTYIYYQNADGVFNSHAAINHPNGTYNFEEYLTVKVVVKDDVYSLYIDGEPVTDAQGNPLTVDNSQNPNKPGRGEIAFMANDTCYIKNFKITPVDGEALHIDPALEAGQRKTIDLDGTWLCQDMPFGAAVDQLPEEFNNSIPVPGLWDMAEKEFSYTCDTEILKTGNYEKKALWYKKVLVFDGEIPTR